jgi:hypothetical protein
LCREHHRQADEGEIPFETIKEIIAEREAKSANHEAKSVSCEAIKGIIDEQEAKNVSYEATKYLRCASR